MGVRSHGFESPLDTRQVSSWFAFGLFLVSFFVLWTPIHTGAGGVTLTCLYAVSAVATIFTGWKAMRIDPSDQGALAKRTGTTILTPAAASERKNYCYHCEAYVNQRSKHCRRCRTRAREPATAEPTASRREEHSDLEVCLSWYL